MCVPKRQLSGRTAFTLIELMAALAILSIIVVVALNMFNVSTNITLRGNSQAERNQVARAVLGLITRDLERTVNLSTAVNLHEIGPATATMPGYSGAELYFLADLPGAQNPYGVVNVGYKMIQTNYAGSTRWVLARGTDALVDTTANPADWFSSLPSGYWQVASENIIGLEFAYYTNVTDTVAAPWDDVTIPNSLPQSVVVTVWAVDTPSYNRALDNPAAASLIITQNVAKYERRVFLPRSTQN